MTFTETFAGRYRLLGALGHGATSDVWEAVDSSSGTRVALKVIRTDEPALAARLEREAATLSTLDHPGLVRMLDTGTADGHPYVVMDLVRGATLATTLRSGPLGATAAAALGADVAEALAYVHRAGIVHRDIKPSNILLDETGRARVADFGIARLADAAALTATGTTVGTVAYMAPEQLESNRVGPPADVWALGIVLLEALTGRRVYQGSPGEVIAARLAGPVPLPGDLAPVWRLALGGMLDHDPGRRLGAAEAAALLCTEAFRNGTAWALGAADATELDLPMTVDYTPDLTALAPTPAALAGADTRVAGATVPLVRSGAGAGAGGMTEPLAAGLTRVLPAGRPPMPLPPGAPAGGRRQDRRLWWLAAAAVVVVVGVVAALAASSGGSSPSPRSVATASTATASTTTAAPSASSALRALSADLSSGAAAGTVPASVGQQIGSAAQQAATDSAAGRSTQAAADLQQAATVLATAEGAGAVSSSEGAVVQRDLSTLAGTLLLPATAATPTTTAPTTVVPPAPVAPAPAHGPADHGGGPDHHSGGPGAKGGH